jgi:hypothetical protein
MKKGFGVIMAVIGGVAALAGIYYVVMGQSNHLVIGGIKALYVGLAGVGLFVIGLTTARD